MFCFLDSCDNNIFQFDAECKEDCIAHHLKKLMREATNICLHYDAMKRKTNEAIAGQARFERKYNSEKEKFQLFKQKYEKDGKRKSPTNDTAVASKKTCKEAPLEIVCDNSNQVAKPDDQDKIFKPRIKATSTKISGKENSPKKLAKFSVAASFAKISNPFKDLPSTSSPKNLKQQKLHFSKLKQQSTTKPSLFKNPKAKPATKPVDDDETFCETLEKANQASIFDDDETFCETPEAVKRKSSGWLSKPQVKEKEAKKIDNGQKGKKPDAPPVRRSLHETSLFAFQLPPARVPSAEPEKEEAQPAKEEPEVKVKQEKLADPESEDLFAGIESFAADMDCESSKGSSVVFVEPDVNLAITIDDPTVQSDDHLNELEANFVNQLYEDSPVKVPTPPRKRTRIYGECADCREFYDNYAQRYGASSANEYVHECPKRCKGFLYRKKQAEPPLPDAHSFVHRETFNQTPEGFWDLRFTTTIDDPDRTQSGL